MLCGTPVAARGTPTLYIKSAIGGFVQNAERLHPTPTIAIFYRDKCSGRGDIFVRSSEFTMQLYYFHGKS